MKPSGWHPPQAVNTHTLCMGDQHHLVRNSVGFLFLFVFPSVPVCQLLMTITWHSYTSVKLDLVLEISIKYYFIKTGRETMEPGFSLN